MSARGMAMASDAPTFLTGALRVADVVLVIATGAISYWLRHDSWSTPGNYIVAILAGGILTLNVMNLGRVYTLANLQQIGFQIGQLLACWIGVVLSLIVLAYFTKSSDEFSRVWLALWVVMAFLAMALERVAVYWQFARWRRRGLLRVKIAIVGATPLATRLRRRLHARKDEQYEFVGIYDDDPPKAAPGEEEVRVTGTIADLLARFRRDPVDEVVIALPWHESERIAALLKELKTLPANVRLCPEAVGFDVPTRGFMTLGGIPMLGVYERPLHGWNIVLKSLEDRLIASVILFLTLPFMALIAIAIKLDSPGPVLFGQKRYGFNNNEFTVYKFRTMVAAAAAEADVRQATRDDPRITRLGAFLRRTSLDELPQLFNVLNGDMSLVGPRPHAVQHNEEFAKTIDDYLGRHRVKPGITGWAQVNGLRGETDSLRKMQLRVQCDLYYIDHWSLFLDLKILFLTVFVGFVHENAY
ncbi:MAG TPA: undecaprenyl-phosphate glucose phosphotransferase [Alphaproteobacteria bacterium]|nr:undecaprenyl-phosphate glucose phosphotransferase [Alphaproteobacteria bacterium]